MVKPFIQAEEEKAAKERENLAENAGEGLVNRSDEDRIAEVSNFILCKCCYSYGTV